LGVLLDREARSAGAVSVDGSHRVALAGGIAQKARAFHPTITAITTSFKFPILTFYEGECGGIQ